MPFDTIVHGDCFRLIAELPDNSIDLIITSPPYAKQRQKTYGGTDPEHYVEWFLPLAQQMRRVLKPTGSFILNIKENVIDGERHTYVIELILALRKQGWRWVDEYIWHKKNCMPGRWPNRLRDAWERCLHFTREKQFAMYQDAVKVKASASTIARGKVLTIADHQRQESAVGSGFGAHMAHCVGRETVLPSNVLHLAAETANVGHSAAFPMALPRFFIDLFTRQGDVVLDPFCGSGTTCQIAQQMNRQFLGYEIDQRYHALALARTHYDDLFCFHGHAWPVPQSS